MRLFKISKILVNSLFYFTQKVANRTAEVSATAAAMCLTTSYHQNFTIQHSVTGQLADVSYIVIVLLNRIHRSYITINLKC